MQPEELIKQLITSLTTKSYLPKDYYTVEDDIFRKLP